MTQKTYRIGDVANLMGLSRDTLRYYEKRGILSSKKKKTDTAIIRKKIFTACSAFFIKENGYRTG